MLLRVDLDDCERPPHVARWAWLMRRAGFRIVWLSQERSPGGKGWHCELALDPEPQAAIEVVALQAVLGSDPAREACNIHRAFMVDSKQVSPRWRKRWNVLYGSLKGAEDA